MLDGLTFATLSLVAATVVLAIATIIYTIYMAKQYHTLSQQNNLIRASLMSDIIREIGQDQIRKARDLILSNSAYDKLENQYPEAPETLPEEMAEARNLAVHYDRIGLITKSDPVLRAWVLDWHADDISRLWKRLKPFVHGWRVRRPGTVPEFVQLGLDASAQIDNVKKGS